MRITVIGKNIEISDYLRDVVEKQAKKLDRYFEKDTEVAVKLSVERNRHIAEVTIPCRDGGVVRAEDVTGDMYASINNALKKIERRLIKHHNKLERDFRSGAFAQETLEFGEAIDASEMEDRHVVKTKQFSLKPMTVEEAIMQLELLGHDFYVFTNGTSGQVNVLYLRHDGDYGLIEPS